jgi:hypothetical protein
MILLKARITMAEYIEREAAIESLPVAWDSAIYALRNVPAADVVPVSELLTLRDALYENDQITMRGLARLNMLIAKYGGYDHG